MHQILVGHAHDPILDSKTLNKMYCFRHKVFYERLGWDVGNENGMERDYFDELDPIYMLARNYHNEIEACWRLLPTTGPYMLKDTFPQLLCGDEAPHDPVIWELSRFAVLPSDSTEQTQATLNLLTFDMIRSVYDFAQQQTSPVFHCGFFYPAVFYRAPGSRSPAWKTRFFTQIFA